MMNKQEQFLRTVESLCDHWPLERARRACQAAAKYEEERLPENVGLAALQFVCGVAPARIFHARWEEAPGIEMVKSM